MTLIDRTGGPCAHEDCCSESSAVAAECAEFACAGAAEPTPCGASRPDPLASLSAIEISRATAILMDAELFGSDTRVCYLGLAEPHKSEVLAYYDGLSGLPERVARAFLLDCMTGVGRDVEISLTGGGIRRCTTIDGTHGQVPILEAEFEAIAGIVRECTAWVEALEARGIDPDQVVCAPLSAGTYPHPGEDGRRIIRVLAFRQDHPADHPWAHPVDGLCAYVDMAARTVFELVDSGHMPVPPEDGNFHLAESRPAPLEGLKPIVITQPEGPSFTVAGESVSWANWSFSVGFDAREGLVLRNVRFADPDHGGEVRPVLYRASISEMIVPYGDPSPVRFWQNYFDIGEYVFGRFVNSLKLGCDCLGEIHYFDAVLSDEFGVPRTVSNAICMHEEDYGTLWKHTDLFAGSGEVRRQRRLVISFFTTVGNYDYGFFWYLYLDGTIECEAKLTGVLFTSSYVEGSPYASQVAPGLGAPYHQHLFAARLDMMVDGVRNAVDEVEAVRLPVSDTNPYGNAFTNVRTRITCEAESGRLADAAVGRSWHVVSSERNNRFGNPTGYMLYSSESPTLMADPSASITGRAKFATKHLWVTQYAPDEQYPSGDFVNQSPSGEGMPQFVAGNRTLDGEDIVLWHVFGPTHFPRPEDWPAMPVDTAKFTLKPYGFFDRNPSLNVPPSAAAHCHEPGV